MKTLTAEEVQAAMATVPGWELDGSAIRRQFIFRSFPEAISFVVRLAFDAEATDHHPDVLVSYKRVTLTWTTHSAGGLTKKDFDGAVAAGRIAETLGAG